MKSLRRSRPSSRARISRAWPTRSGCEMANGQLAGGSRLLKSADHESRDVLESSGDHSAVSAKPGAPSNTRCNTSRRSLLRPWNPTSSPSLVGFDLPPTARSSNPSRLKSIRRAWTASAPDDHVLDVPLTANVSSFTVPAKDASVSSSGSCATNAWLSARKLAAALSRCFFGPHMGKCRERIRSRDLLSVCRPRLRELRSPRGVLSHRS